MEARSDAKACVLSALCSLCLSWLPLGVTGKGSLVCWDGGVGRNVVMSWEAPLAIGIRAGH